MATVPTELVLPTRRVATDLSVGSQKGTVDVAVTCAVRTRQVSRSSVAIQLTPKSVTIYWNASPSGIDRNGD